MREGLEPAEPPSQETGEIRNLRECFRAGQPSELPREREWRMK